LKKLKKLLTNVLKDGTPKLKLNKKEITDVFIVLLSLAGMAKIDVAEAVKLKEEKNKKRSWE
jgi:NTP pyrophosphatase (non-canonical NTP hydrolase)